MDLVCLIFFLPTHHPPIMKEQKKIIALRFVSNETSVSISDRLLFILYEQELNCH